MRQYLLYVKVENDSTQAYITPCYEVDRQYWEQRNGGRLFVIGKSPSLALAFYLREIINNQLKSQSVTSDSINNLRQLASTSVKEANELYGRETEGILSAKDQWFEFVDDIIENSEPVSGDELAALSDESERIYDLLEGRALLLEEMEFLLEKHQRLSPSLTQSMQRLVLQGLAEWFPGVRLFIRRGWWRHRLVALCERCGSKEVLFTICHTCGQGCAYCTACLGMGRSKCCSPYICLPAKRGATQPAVERPLLQWDGQFSPLQARAAEKARLFVSKRETEKSFLLWAVCGAGKTELLFPSIEETLSAGGQVLVATPRKDVVMELVPRIKKVFPTVRVIAVHGSSQEKWEDGGIIVATTHQVMRFYQKFSLVVIDEVDAFPFHNNQLLYRAVSRAVQPDGKLLYLSATPPEYLRKELVKTIGGQHVLESASHVLLPKRYHGFPIPMPTVEIVTDLKNKIKAGQRITPIIEVIQRSIRLHRQVFVFVPRIEDVSVILSYLQSALPNSAGVMEGVHAADPEREQKVMSFRSKAYMLLVTTTILERGVTIPRSDVIVLGADAPVFDESSLVQIAGRVGRSADAPTGTILFVMDSRAKVPFQAIKQIKLMNRLGARLKTGGMTYGS